MMKNSSVGNWKCWNNNSMQRISNLDFFGIHRFIATSGQAQEKQLILITGVGRFVVIKLAQESPEALIGHETTLLAGYR